MTRPVVVKQLPERLSVGQGHAFFREVLKVDRPLVVLDCSKLRQLDRAGIQVLLHCLEEAMKRNGDVKLAAIPPAAAEFMELTRVDHLFEAFDNTADAVNSFQQFPGNTCERVLAPSLTHAKGQSASSKVTGRVSGR